MVNDIIQAIVWGINTEFGDGTVIYTEMVEQNLQTPCFFVRALTPTRERYPGGRYLTENPFCIQYIPDDKFTAAEKCNEVAQSLFCCLELVTDSSADLVRGAKMRYEIVDGVLNFFVNYDLFIRYEDDETDKMTTMEHTANVKGDE